GFSLGGAVLLKWLGEVGVTSAIRAAATISAPYDLATAARHMEGRVGRFYCAHFMSRLKGKALDLLARFPRATAHIDPDRVRQARTFHDFDDALTAPLHGFADADDYYARSSALPFLARVAVPTLCFSAEDDPFFPAGDAHRARAAASASLRFEISPRGGHAGFVGGSWPWRPRYWAEEGCMRWLIEHAARAGDARAAMMLSA